MRRPAIDWQTWIPWVGLLIAMAVELLTPKTLPLAAFLIIPVVASAALGRPVLTASMTVVSLLFAIPAQEWLGYDLSGNVRRSVLIAFAGIVGCVVAAAVARATRARGEAQQLLAASEEQYRLLAENSSDLIVHVRDGRVVWTSPSVEGVLGAPQEHWVGREVREVVPAEDRPAFAERLAILAAGGSVQQRVRVVSLDGVTHWVHLHAKPFYDADGHMDGFTGSLRVVDDEVAAEQQAEETRRQLENARIKEAESDALERGVIDRSIVPTAMSDLDGPFVLINNAMCDFVGYDADTLRQMTWQEIVAPEFLPAALQVVPDLLAGKLDVYRVQQQYLHRDGRRVWGDMAASVIRAPDGRPKYLIAQILDITAEMESRRQLGLARREQARADALYRRSMESSAVGMCLAQPTGAFLVVNDAMCEFFGYDEQTLLTKTWMELTAPDYLQADLDKVADMVAGRIESYRMTKQFIHADGHRIWGDLTVGCLRNPDGGVETSIGQIVDVTDEVKAREQLALSEERNRLTAVELQHDLDSAAHYLYSVLPGDLDGIVRVSSRYLPSRTIGGDCFDYRWIDDDHLMVYLLDVSGHGVDSALMAVSVHNTLRSDLLPAETLRQPDQVLATLNRRFDMDRHDDKYFTMWFGVYQPSTATLRFASAGHPPVLLITAETVTPLSTQAPPVGTFTDTVFTTATHHLSGAGDLLVYSDGAFDLALHDGGQSSLPQFITLCTTTVRSPGWTLDTLVDKLRAIGTFTDDCSLIRVELG